MNWRYILVVILSVGFMSACSSVRIKEHKEWEKYFDAYDVMGSFEIYDNNKEIAHYYNKELCAEQITPAETFDVLVALTALETVVAKDELKVIKWDGVIREHEDWNQDLTLTEAFKLNSTSHIQTLVEEIGESDMYHYLFAVQYGNMEIGDSINNFWMDGTLGISPDEQVGFMKRLYHTELPQFNERSHRIVRGMMFQDEGESYRMYYKVGHDKDTDPDRVWIVGFIESFQTRRHVKTKRLESIPHPHFFAITVQSKSGNKDLEEVSFKLLWDLLNVNGIGDGVGFEKL